MAAMTFPTGLFGFLTSDVDIERQTLEGGTAISGEQDVTATDGGGRVYADFSDGALVDRDKRLAWRAVLTGLDGGITPAIVFFCDVRHTPYGGGGSVGFSDGTTFSDGSLFSTGGPSATAVDAAPLRATSIRLALIASRPFIGGEWFSLQHPGKGWRAYRIATIAPDGTATFRPPLREAVVAGEAVEVARPRCLMRQRPGSSNSATSYGRLTSAAIRFVEAP